MISVFQYRGFGFIFYLTIEERERVNQYRLGKKFLDIEAAKDINGSEFKKDIEKGEYHFVTYFEYGTSNSAY